MIFKHKLIIILNSVLGQINIVRETSTVEDD